MIVVHTSWYLYQQSYNYCCLLLSTILTVLCVFNLSFKMHQDYTLFQNGIRATKNKMSLKCKSQVWPLCFGKSFSCGLKFLYVCMYIWRAIFLNMIYKIDICIVNSFCCCCNNAYHVLENSSSFRRFHRESTSG